MSCGHCSSQVEGALAAVDGVTSASVDLDSGLATIVGTAPTAALVEAVERTGKTAIAVPEGESAALATSGTGRTRGASEMTVTLVVEGMVCEACRATVMRVLKSMPGVSNVMVNLHTKLVTVSSHAAAADLMHSIASAGRFAAREVVSDGTEAAAGPLAPSAALRRCVELRVEDMVCNGCKAKVSRALKMLRGVHEVDIDLEVHAVHVVGHVPSSDMIATVGAAGYSAELRHEEVVDDAPPGAGGGGGAGPAARGKADLEGAAEVVPLVDGATKPQAADRVKSGGKDSHVQEVVLSVGGMTCASCVGAVEGGLLSLEGISVATVALMSKSAKVTYDARLIDVPAICARVAALGYPAEPQAEDIEAVAAASSFGKEAAHWRRMFAGSLLFTLPVFLLSMLFKHLPSTSPALHREVVPGLSVIVLLNGVLTTPVQFFFGYPFHQGAYKAVRRCQFNMDVLVSLGTFAAYGYSIVFIAVSLATAGDEGADNEQFETAAMLITFILLGKYLESAAKGRASSAITQLLTLQPPTALQLETCKDVDHNPTEVPVSGLRRGDVVKVLPGAQVPVDGMVLYGESAVDESMITGESLPQAKRGNDRVVGGTINGSGVLYVLVTAVGADSTLAQIMRVVADAQHRKPQIQAFADKISAVFVPVVITIALLVWAAWAIVGATGHMPKVGGDCDGGDAAGNMSDGHGAGHGCGGGHEGMSMGMPRVHDDQLLAFMFGCAVLVIACPCALGLATPTAVMVGGGVGAAHGILIKGGDVLERAAAVQTICFDKTGTLTTGRLSVARVMRWAADISEAALFRAVGSAERGSEHPIAKALLEHASLLNVSTVEPSDFVASAGSGLQCFVDGRAVLLGNRSWMDENGLGVTEEQEAEVAALENRGHTVVFVALSREAAADGHGDTKAADGVAADADGRSPAPAPAPAHSSRLFLAGAIAVADSLKPDARAVIKQLTQKGVQVWMISGDNERTAAHIAAEAGVDVAHVVAGVKPAGKLAKVQELRDLGAKIAFVGDGVNDAPALAIADVGIAVGTGTDVAIETADVVLMKSTLQDVVTALDLSCVVMRRIRLNFVWAFAYNVIGIPLAAGALYPGLGIQFPPMFAGAAMALSSVSVVCSSVLLRFYQPPKPLSLRRRADSMRGFHMSSPLAKRPPGEADRIDVQIELRSVSAAASPPA